MDGGMPEDAAKPGNGLIYIQIIQDESLAE